MTEHKATPEQWAAAEHFGHPNRTPRPLAEYACLLELRARVEALEVRAEEDKEAWAAMRRAGSRASEKIAALEDAIKSAESNYPEKPDSSLVEQVRCKSCMWFAPKQSGEFLHLGRCRRHAPTMNGYPVVFVNDWCGDHKLNEAWFASYPS